MKLLNSSSLCLLTLSLWVFSWGPFELCAHAFQKPTKESSTAKEKDRRTKETLERRSAVIRLQAAGDRARTLDDSIAKTQILASVADALWDQNETRARALFTAAFHSIDGIKLDPKFDQRESVAQRRGGRFGPLFQLRSSVLERVARRDFKLAESLRQSVETASDGSDSKSEAIRKADLSQLYLNLAVALAKTQPNEALRLLRQSYSEVGPPLVFALLRIREDNPTLADQVFREALSAATANPMASDDLQSFASYVLPTEEDHFYGKTPIDDPSRTLSIMSFLDYVFNGLTTSNHPDIEVSPARADINYHTLQNVLPLFQRLQPERVLFVTQRMGAMLTLISPKESDTGEPVAEETLDELIRQAEAAVGDRKRTILLIRASDAAARQNDLDKALSVAELISDLHERKIQTSLVLFSTAMRELHEGKLERAYTLARRIEFMPQRLVVFTRLAEELWASKQVDAAEVKMEEIWEWVNKADNSPQKIDAMLKLTALVASRDTVRGFEWLQSTSRALNSTDFTPEPVDLSRISVEVQITLEALDLESSFGTLARSDFERAFSIAHSLTKPESALLAETIVCKRVLQAR